VTSLPRPTWSRFKFTEEQRQKIIAEIKADPKNRISMFLSMTELDVEMLILGEEEERKDSGRPHLKSRRFFAAQLAERCRWYLSITPGCGRGGPYYRMLCMCLEYAGINVSDPYVISSDAIKSVNPDDRDLGDLPRAEQNALSRLREAKKERATKNRVERRKPMK
jgi:hypothetical protein